MNKLNIKKKDIIIFSILVLISIVSLIFVNNNYNLYKDTIVRITSIKNVKKSESSNGLGLKEKYYTQKITGIVLNGKEKNKKVHLENESSTSSVVDEKYSVGDKIFVQLDKSIINGLKRDQYITILIIVFILSIFLVGKFRGLCAVISVTVNTIIFYSGLNLYFNGMNLLLLCMLEATIFTILSLLIAGGKNKKTASAILSVFVSMTILFIISLIVVKLTNYKGISFNDMSFITVPIEDVFFAELMIGGLGAIMDVSITMSSSIAELIEKNKKISTKALMKSGREIGKDIMGTMINVLFFTYLCSGLPIFVLAVRNGFSVYNYITTNFSLEITRFLIGSIGIVLAIPIGLFISIKVFKRGDK